MQPVAIGTIIGGVLLILGGEIVKINEWKEVLTPTFVGALCVQTGGLLFAIYGALKTTLGGDK